MSSTASAHEPRSGARSSASAEGHARIGFAEGAPCCLPALAHWPHGQERPRLCAPRTKGDRTDLCAGHAGCAHMATEAVGSGRSRALLAELLALRFSVEPMGRPEELEATCVWNVRRVCGDASKACVPCFVEARSRSLPRRVCIPAPRNLKVVLPVFDPTQCGDQF